LYCQTILPSLASFERLKISFFKHHLATFFLTSQHLTKAISVTEEYIAYTSYPYNIKHPTLLVSLLHLSLNRFILLKFDLSKKTTGIASESFHIIK